MHQTPPSPSLLQLVLTDQMYIVRRQQTAGNIALSSLHCTALFYRSQRPSLQSIICQSGGLEKTINKTVIGYTLKSFIRYAAMLPIPA